MGDIGQVPFRLRIDKTILLYLIACLMSPSPLIHLAESRVDDYQVQIQRASSPHAEATLARHKASH